MRNLRQALFMFGAVAAFVAIAWSSVAAEISVAPTGDVDLDAALGESINLSVLESTGFAAQSIENERRRLTEMVRAFGYFDARVDLSADARTVAVNVVIGAPYRIGSIQVGGTQNAISGEFETDTHGLISSAVGLPARADVLATLASDVLWRARAASFPDARIDKITAVPHAATATVSVVIDVATGSRAALGDVTFSRPGSLDVEHLKSLVPFDAGAPYSPEAIDQLDSALRSLPLVRRTEIDLTPAADGSGRVAVDVKLRTFADHTILDRNKPLGIAVLAVVLGAVMLRQIMMAAGRRAASAPVLAATVVAALLSVAAVFLVLDRAISFAQIVL